MVVTGANGYIGAQVTRYVLAAGFRVRGTVRKVDDKKNDFLRALSDRHEGRLELVAASLTDAAPWRAALAGATYVLHVASPVPVELPKDVEADLIRPAVDGVRHVMNAAIAEGGVRRVVLTSSIAAVFEGRTDMHTHTFSDTDWSEAAKAIPYARSKTLAEQEAWRIVKAQPAGRGLELVSINPGFVLGPVLGTTQSSTGEVMSRLLNRTMPLIPDLQMPYIHVYDVALAHVRAMLIPAAAGRRFILVSETLPLRRLAVETAAAFNPAGFSVPTTGLPNWLFHLASWFDSALAQVAEMLSPIAFDTAPARTVLRIAFRAGAGAATDMGASMIANGIIADRSTDKRYSSGDAARRWVAPPPPTREELDVSVVA